jgi:hypothetical protein
MIEKRRGRRIGAMNPRDAFVIWIDAPTEAALPSEAADAAPPSEPLRGHIEHVQSSARASFTSLAELLVFLEGHRNRKGTPEGEA